MYLYGQFLKISLSTTLWNLRWRLGSPIAGRAMIPHRVQPIRRIEELLKQRDEASLLNAMGSEVANVHLVPRIRFMTF